MLLLWWCREEECERLRLATERKKEVDWCVDLELLLLCRLPDEPPPELEPLPKMEDWVGGGPEVVGIGGGDDSSFCTNMGMSLSSAPVSSSYRHRFVGAGSCVVLATVPVSATFPLPLFAPGAGISGTPVETVVARDHS